MIFNLKGSDCIKKSKFKFLLLGIFFCIIMSISGIYALSNQETNGIIKTDIVDIRIQNYKLEKNNNEIEYGTEINKVMPGDNISIIPKISNLGMDCYLRIKVNYVDNNIDFTDYVTGFSKDFTKYGDYYYYNRILNSNETIKLFDTIRIPKDVRSLTKNNNIKLEIITEAIQGKNFQPDYTLANPWKNVKPEKTVNSTYDIDAENSKVLINYENNTDKDISVSNNFLERARRIVPCDSFTDTMKIKNANKENAKYYLKLNTNKNNIKETNLLNQIQLIITRKNGQVVYNGKLLNEDKILLGEYKLNEEDELYFKVSVPEELDNQFENINPGLLLVFSAEYDTKEKTEWNPKTGDSIDVAITIFVISSIGLAIVMLLAYIEERKEY